MRDGPKTQRGHARDLIYAQLPSWRTIRDARLTTKLHVLEELGPVSSTYLIEESPPGGEVTVYFITSAVARFYVHISTHHLVPVGDQSIE